MMQKSMTARGMSLLAVTPLKAKQAKTTGADVVQVAAGDGVNGWCNSVGCFYLTAETPQRHWEFDSVGQYGYGSTTLGQTTVRINDELLDSVSFKTSQQWFKSTRGVRSAYWTVYQYGVVGPNGTYPYGTPCGPQQSMSTVSKDAGLSVSLAPLYWDARDCGWQVQSLFHRIYWRDPSSAYPGRWYLFAKMDKMDYKAGTQLKFEGNPDTPVSPSAPDGAGWENV